MAVTRTKIAQTSEAGAAGVQGMLAGTPVLTLDGALPVDYLSPGDRVLTRGGARRVAQIEVTVVAHARVVTIAADTLGVGKPVAALTVSAAMGVLLRDWRAKAMYGAEQVVIPAGRLADGCYVKAETLTEARLYTLVFDEPAVIHAGGLELACEGVKVRA